MAITLAAAKAAAKDRLGVPTSDNAIPAATLNYAVNAALRTIAKVTDWPWLYKVGGADMAGGVRTFPMPADAYRLISVVFEGRPLQHVSMMARTDPDATGDPETFTVQGSTVVVEPPSDELRFVTINYTRKEPVLVADADVALLPDEHLDWLAVEAAIYLALRTNNKDRLPELREESKLLGSTALRNRYAVAGGPAVRHRIMREWHW